MLARRLVKLPARNGRLHLSWVGMETDLIFNRGVDLPGFASFPLLESAQGRKLLLDYFADQVEVARNFGYGLLLESPTWMANRDRGGPLGYPPARLLEFNSEAIEMMAEFRDLHPDTPILLSAQVGPRNDAYLTDEQMTKTEAQVYHSEQIGVLSETEADLISAFTLGYVAEAIGITRASQAANIDVVISFTVETDGNLPSGETLQAAIETVDRETACGPAYYLINCAHPDHFQHILTEGAWIGRLGGVIANASRCSHAELDNSETLDDGDPQELGAEIGDLYRKFPHFSVLGGCCGTDMRHMREIAKAMRQ